MRKVIKNCLTCGKEFKVWPYIIKNGYGKCCSWDCSSIFKKGRPNTSRTKFVKGQKAWNKNKPAPWANIKGLEIGRGWNKDKYIQTNTGKTHFKKGEHPSPNTEFKKGSFGDKSFSWKGGITPENKKIRNGIEIRLWREAVFARDNWTCQKTGIKGGRLHSHHIQNFADFPELRFAIDNGITLSDKSHKEFHKKYGKRNNTLIQLKEFLKQC